MNKQKTNKETSMCIKKWQHYKVKKEYKCKRKGKAVPIP
jgi:hypothetical protein